MTRPLRTNCLLYALDQWRREGGYLVMRRSEHWRGAHVAHLSADRQTLTHFVPPERLRHPAQAVIGFEGIVRHADTAPAPRLSISGVLCSAVVLLGLALWWSVTRLWRPGDA